MFEVIDGKRENRSWKKERLLWIAFPALLLTAWLMGVNLTASYAGVPYRCGSAINLIRKPSGYQIELSKLGAREVANDSYIRVYLSGIPAGAVSKCRREAGLKAALVILTLIAAIGAQTYRRFYWQSKALRRRSKRGD